MREVDKLATFMWCLLSRNPLVSMSGSPVGLSALVVRWIYFVINTVTTMEENRHGKKGRKKN